MSPPGELPIVAPGYDSGSVTRKITDLVLRRPLTRGWLAGFGFAFALLMLLNFAIGWLLLKGVGIWGVNIPVAWGFAIVNFVWWIGIGHAGTFISAILLLLHQDWRTSINRFAEAMTLFAVACAGLFPLLHLGRPWVFYWLLPYPDTMDLWPQWRSPLVWDVFAVSTYLTVSLMFWYVGLIPDLATMRDRAGPRPVHFLYGILALGWRGSARHWKRFQMAYLLLAGLATPLVLSVHSVVSLDFAVAIVPGWHSTIFPPYFVAGAIFSGFAMVLTLVIPVRQAYGLKDFITIRHLENCAKIMLATGLMVAHGYTIEAFMSWYSGDKFDIYMTLNRIFGPYAPAWWLLIGCNVLVPQALWFKKIRTSPALLFVIALLVNVGMWTERYVIVVTSLHRDFMPSAWGLFHPTRWDWMTLIGSFGLFLSLLFLFLRLLPAISMTEMRELVIFKPGAAPKMSPNLHGMMAEFAEPKELLAAARAASAAGYRKMDAYSPFPIEGLAEAIGFEEKHVAPVVLAGGLLGAAVGYGMQYYSAVWDYPLNVGGRPLHSWPSFIPITFELTVLFAAFAAVFGMLLMNRLPQPYHPVFNAPEFKFASQTGFFLCLEASDAQFGEEKARGFLQSLGPVAVHRIEP